MRGVDGRNQADVRQLGDTMHEDHVRRLDVTVDESVRVQMRQRAREGKADGETFLGREPLLPGAQFLERLGDVTVGENFIASLNVVRELHHIIEKTGGVIASDVQQADLRFLPDGHRLETFYAGELAVEGTVFVEACAADNLHRPVNARDTAREPNFAVGSAAHGPEQRVISDRLREVGHWLEFLAHSASGGNKTLVVSVDSASLAADTRERDIVAADV